MKTGEMLHMAEGEVKYADDTLYTGQLKMGRPHGKGALVNRLGEDDNYEKIFTYDGEFDQGERHGEGKLTYHYIGITYKGQWKQGKKHGKGKQSVSDDQVEEYGYKEYDGEWIENRRHGEGKMTLPTSVIYEGPFENNHRMGVGMLLPPKDEHHAPVKVRYDNPKEAEADLLKIVGGEGKDVFVEDIYQKEGDDKKDDKKKAKGKKGKKDAGKAADDDGEAKDNKAERHGVHPGWMIHQIAEDDKEFKTWDPEELWTKLGDIYDEAEPITFIFTEPRKPLYRGNWLDDKICTSPGNHAWMWLSDNSLYYGMVNTKGNREGTGILYAKDAHDHESRLMRAWQTGVPYNDPSTQKLKYKTIVYEGQFKKG